MNYLDIYNIEYISTNHYFIFHHKNALVNQWGFPLSSLGKLLSKNFLVSSITSWSIAKGKTANPYCIKMLSRVPNTILKG